MLVKTSACVVVAVEGVDENGSAGANVVTSPVSTTGMLLVSVVVVVVLKMMVWGSSVCSSVTDEISDPTG